MRPPKSEMVTASMRNCTRMSDFLAPTALRTPISRVRSVTETNMMFMMPMPPTSNAMLTTPATTLVNVPRMEPRSFQDLLLQHDPEIVSLAFGDAVTGSQNLGNLVFGQLYLVGPHSLEVEDQALE